MNKGLRYLSNYLLQHRIKSWLQRCPKLYINLQLFRYRGQRYQRKIVTSNTDIVIEGFPRSANSFSVKAFKFANGEDTYKIATHLHAYPQIVMGVKYKIPTLVLVREPFACIASYAALRAQNYGVNKFNRGHNIKWLLDDYVNFYEALLPYKSEVCVAHFKEVLEDYGQVLKNLNIRYGTSFKEFEHTPENVETVFSSAKEHLSPSKKRDDIKNLYVKELEGLRETKAFRRAEELYQIWLNESKLDG